MVSKRIAVLISGGGTTLKNLIECSTRKQLNAEIACVVSSNLDARGLAFAKEAGIATHVVNWKNFRPNICSKAPSGGSVSGTSLAAGSSSAGSLASQKLFEIVENANMDLVVAGGFLKKLTIPKSFENRVVNIHPSLIPAFCGQGFYGLHVHRAVLEFGCKVSGCTVHFVDNEFDHGPIIAQEAVSVHNGDTPEQLAARVFELECKLYPHTINRLLHETWAFTGRRVEFANQIGRPANEN